MLCKERSEPHMNMTVQSFIDNSYKIDFCSLNQIPKAWQDILSILDTNEPFLFSATEQDFVAFKGFISRV